MTKVRLVVCVCFTLLIASVSAAPPRASGYNLSGQIGDGTNTRRTTAVPVQTTEVFTKLAAGASHSIGVRMDGRVFAWGANTYGQLGEGTVMNRSTPVAVSASGVLSGRVVTAVASHGDSTYALLDDGTVAAWGKNLDGELGDGTMTNRKEPILVTNLGGVSKIEAGLYHSLAVMLDGTVRAWGYNGQGQIGDGTTTQRLTPVPVSGLATVTGVSGGDYHSLALLADGTVWAWGFNGNGQLGDGSSVQRKSPVAVSGLSAVTEVSAGAAHSVALRSDGTVWTWGSNASGELGLGDNADRSTPQMVGGISTAVQVAATGHYTIVRLADGTLRAFGDNSTGQLGDNSTTDRNAPVVVSDVGGSTGVAAGGFHIVVLAVALPITSASAATEITTTTATLSGAVNPSESPTTAQFEYGLTSEYGTVLPITLTPNDGSTSQDVSVNLSNLLAGTVYHFRLKATNISGTTFSADRTFTTRTLFTQWKIDVLGDANASDTGDPDADGLKNLVEYASGSDPKAPDNGPTVSVTDGRLEITFARSTAASDATLTVQGSDDLKTWTDLASSANGQPVTALVTGIEVEETGMAPTVSVRVRDVIETGDSMHPRRFLRLLVAH